MGSRGGAPGRAEMEGDGNGSPQHRGGTSLPLQQPQQDLKVSGAGSTRRDLDAAVSELPLSCHLSCRAHAGGSERRALPGAQGSGQSEPCGLQQAHSLPPRQACRFSARAVLLCLLTARQPATLPAASHGGSRQPPRCRGAVSARSLPSSDGAGLAVSSPQASSSAGARGAGASCPTVRRADVLRVCPAACSCSPGSWRAGRSPGLPSQRLAGALLAFLTLGGGQG